MSVRVLAYNVLAQCLAKSNWFPYVKGNALKWKQRFPRLCNQITAVDADILCLSEIDEIGSWRSFLEAKGYEVIFKPKPGGKMWGSLLAFKKASFSLEKAATCDMNDAAIATHFGILAIDDSLASDERSAPALARDGQAIFALLKPKSETVAAQCDSVLVATTHLFWDPRMKTCKVSQAAQIRLCVADLLKTQPASARIGLIIAGDLNSLPGDPAYRLLQRVDTTTADASMVALWDRLTSDAPPGCSLPSLADARASRPPPLTTPPSAAELSAAPSAAPAAASSAAAPKIHPYWLPLEKSLSAEYQAWLQRLSAGIIAALKECAVEPSSSSSSSSSEGVIELRSAYAAHRRESLSTLPSPSPSLSELSPSRWEPEWTTLTADWRGCIDYLFFSIGSGSSGSSPSRVNWRVTGTLALPTEADVKRDGAVAMPSEAFPSDHCPLAAELTFG